MAELAASLDNIRKTYRVGLTRKKGTAVDGLSLEVSRGIIFGLLGPNGAGKTTTLKILLGLVFPDAGSGTLLGRPLGDRAAHQRIGFLPEEPYFYGFLTAEKGLDLYGRFFGLGGEERRSRTAQMLELVGLRRGSHLSLDKYSKGMVQRFGIAQSLMNDPELVIMDEPSSGLDPVGQKEVRDVLLDLKSQGKTIFLSSHQLSEVENICDTVGIMSQGKIARYGELSRLLTLEGMTRVTLKIAGRAAADRLREVALSVVEDEGSAVLDVGTPDVYRVLELARELSCELVSVSPCRRSLEDLFMEAIKGKAG